MNYEISIMKLKRNFKMLPSGKNFMPFLTKPESSMLVIVTSHKFGFHQCGIFLLLCTLSSMAVTPKGGYGGTSSSFSLMQSQ